MLLAKLLTPYVYFEWFSYSLARKNPEIDVGVWIPGKKKKKKRVWILLQAADDEVGPGTCKNQPSTEGKKRNPFLIDKSPGGFPARRRRRVRSENWSTVFSGGGGGKPHCHQSIKRGPKKNARFESSDEELAFSHLRAARSKARGGHPSRGDGAPRRLGP